MFNIHAKDRDKDIHLKEYYDVDNGQEYRYLLSRYWDNADRIVTVIMCNPSDASYLYEDKTVMNVNNFFVKEDYNKINIVNLFAYRNKNKNELRHMKQKYENINNNYIQKAFDEANLIVVAWGYGKESEYAPKYMKCRIKSIKIMLKDYKGYDKKIKCFTAKGKEKNLHPRDLNLETWYLTEYF